MIANVFDHITRLSLRYRWGVLAVALITLALGGYGLTKLNLELLPRIEFPQTIVIVQWPDSPSSDEFLQKITLPLEEKFKAIEGVVNVESTTNPSFGLIIVRNDFGLDQDKILASVQTAVDTAALPEGAKPQVLNFSLSDLPVISASISSSELSLSDLKANVSRDLQPGLEAIDQVSRVTVGGGQELPEEEVAVVPTVAPTLAPSATPDPGLLPFVVVQGAKSFGLELTHAQELTPDMLRGLSGTPEQILAVLKLVPPETLQYVPAETLAFLPKEYAETLDPALQTQLNDLAKEFGGIGQYSAADVVLALNGELTPTAEPTTIAEATPSPEATVVAAVPTVAPVALPVEWVTAVAAMGQTMTDTTGLTPEVMQVVVNVAGPQLTAFPPEVWRAIDPASLAIALPVLGKDLDPALVAELTAMVLAANGTPAEPVALPDSWIQVIAANGFAMTNTAQIPANFILGLTTPAPQLFADLTPEVILAFAPDVQAALPTDYVATLDAGLQQTLQNIAVYHAQYLAQQEGGEATATVTLPAVLLPDSWIAAAASFGQPITNTSQVAVPMMQALAGTAPDQLKELTPEMWLALDPAVVAVALPVINADLDPALLAELTAVQAASQGQAPEPVALPDSWIAAAAAGGFPLKTTADVPAQAMGLLVTSAPQLLADLTPDVLWGFPPDVLAALPPEYIATLEPETQTTLNAIAIVNAQYVAASQPTEEGTATATPEPVDPARLPDVLIQGAKAAGADIEFAQDITPAFMRQLGAIPQAAQFLTVLTPDNLRLLQPEVIALLPADFVATLPDDLHAELDTLAADFDGAGALAVKEAEEREAAAAGAPALAGIWLQPAPNGDPSQFQNAADLLNNPFAPGAAALLNFFPTAPNVQNPPEWMSALSPDVMKYLADNEPDFVKNLSPIILEMMSPETLTFLLENYPDSFDAELTARLQGIAAGTVKAFVPEASITRTDGNSSVILSVYKDGDANTVEVAHRVFDLLDAYKAKNPQIETSLVFEQATFIEDSIAGVSREGALGGVFAILVILYFLSGRVRGKYQWSWRATVVTAVSIPLSIFTAVLLMHWVPPTLGTWLHNLADSTGNGAIRFFAQLFPTSITLNIMTLSGLTVAIGRVVDDSIVVLENSYRYLQAGDDPAHAVIEGTKEVAIAIFSATATTVAVFLPLGLIGGIIGSFFLPFGLTVTYALAASFIVSITVTPALTYMMISKENIPDDEETAMQKWYTPILEWCLKNRAATLGAATLLFIGSLFLLAQLPQSFIPGLGEPTINVTVNLPTGTGILETNAQVETFEAAIKDLAGIERIQTEVGSNGGFAALFGGGNVNQNQAAVTVSVADPEQLSSLTTAIRAKAQEVFEPTTVKVSAAAQTGFSGFSLIITGSTQEELLTLVDSVKGALSSVDVDADGVADIANVTSNVDGGATTGADTIIRIDGRSAISFGGELETENTLGVTAAAKQAIVDLKLPAGVEVTEGFDSQQQVEGFRNMVKAIGYSVLIVYFIMALTFRSFVHPFTILFSLPFALVGASIALYITNSVLGISAMIGFMMLVGIVVTNGIVLMELVQQLRHKGKAAYPALVEGGRTRLRPIWMTALAAILALIPLAASNEAGAIIASELARAVMGGLLVSTALTLVVIPVVYSLFDELTQRLTKKA